MDLPKRKHPRLKNYDYGQNGCYFVTVCSKNRSPVFGHIVGRDALIPPQMVLSDAGKLAERYINNISLVYESISLDKYVIMPNHIHMLLSFDDMTASENGGMRASRPTLTSVIRSIKTMVTRDIGHSIWQASFYEHIIRNSESYDSVCKYIDDNPRKWTEDKYYL